MFYTVLRQWTLQPLELPACHGADRSSRTGPAALALKPPIAVEAERTVFVRVDPGHSTDQGLLNSYSTVTVALKRAVELQPAAEGRSFQVVIDGERTGQ